MYKLRLGWGQTLALIEQLSKPDVTQLKANLKQLALRLDIVATWDPHHSPHINFSATSRPAREVKFGTDTQ